MPFILHFEPKVVNIANSFGRHNRNCVQNKVELFLAMADCGMDNIREGEKG